MNNSIQWPKTGDVLGDFILNSALEITSARARFLATHEPSDKSALIVCGTSELDSKLFMKRLTDLALCQFKRGAKVMDANKHHDFYWIASEYPECENLTSALKRKLAAQKSLHDLGQRFHLATTLGIGIASTLDRFYEAGFVHGDLDPFRTVLGLRGNRLKCILFETGFSRLFDPDFDRIRAHPLFCAPELLHGHPPSLRADLYACAMIMRVLMLGSPFSSDPEQLLRQCQQERPAPLKQSWPNLARLSDLLDAALEKDPANRPKDWDEFLEELSLFLAEIGVLYGEEEKEETPSAESLTFEASADSEEDERSSIPAKSKLHALVSVPAPKSANKQRLAKPSKGMRAGHPLSIVGRAGKTQGPCFQASAQCGVFRIAEAIDGQGAMQRYRASDANTENEALLVCARTSDADQERFKQWIEKRAGLQMKGVPALLGGGVDGDLGFIGEEGGNGLRLEEALPIFSQSPLQWRAHICAASAIIMAEIMHKCAESGFLHGNLDPYRNLFYEFGGKFNLTIHEIGLLQGLNAQSAARANPYAAPEVREGKVWDHRADIFSYAAILFEQLSGAKVEAMRNGDEDMRFGIPLCDALVCALAADPEKRFASWVEFRAAVKKAIPKDLLRQAGMPIEDAPRSQAEHVASEDEASSSSASEPSSPGGSGPTTSGSVPTVKPATKPWRPPSSPAMTPEPIALRQGKQGGNDAAIEQTEPARSSSKKPEAFKIGDPIPSTLRSEGVQKERRALILARSTSATLMRWTPSPMKVYERSPMMVFTRSPVRVYERAPLALRRLWGRLMKFDAMKNAKPLRTAFAALAVAAVVLVMLGAGILLRPKPSVLAANSIEMAIPELHSVSAEPVRVALVVVVAPVVEKTHAKAKDAEAKSAEPKAIKNSTSARTAPAPSVPKPKALKNSNSKDLDPKRSLKNGLFDYGEKAGANPEQ